MRLNLTQAPNFCKSSASMPETANSSGFQSPDELPEFIAHYRILQRLGKGGMGSNNW